jgi:L-rhamnose-H+ transport protein
VVLLGGFTTNFIWCVILNIRNRTGRQYFRSDPAGPNQGNTTNILENATDAPGEEMAKMVAVAAPPSTQAPLLANYFFSAVAGTTWYFQFFFYTMGETQMGQYKFSSWTLHMASIMIFGSLWGITLKEWKGAGTPAGMLLATALILLVGSTVIVGYGNYIGLAR